MLLRVLERLRDHPAEPKFRSISATSERLQKDVLGVEGGEALLLWCGFLRAGPKYEAEEDVGFAGRHEELLDHATRERDRALRRARDERIAARRLQELPTGDTGPPLRRWGGRLPSWGARGAWSSGMACSKITCRVVLETDLSPRGLKPLNLAKLCTQAVDCLYEYCWHAASVSWYCFDDSRVRQVPAKQVAEQALNEGAYVLFLERGMGNPSGFRITS
ncbi:unnamed protein product [Effrenium voratum]|nr:unnamed protein product [Effrenium voratum]